MIVIKENLTTEDYTIKEDQPAKNKKKIKYLDITLDITTPEKEISQEEEKKIAEKIKNLFPRAEIEINGSKEENEQQVIHIKIVQNEKE